MEQQNSKQVKVWGIVKNKEGNLVPYKNVRLMERMKRGTRSYYRVVQEGTTNGDGLYSFEIQVDRISQYKVLVIDE